MYQYSSGLWDSTTLRSVNLVEFFFYNVKVKHQVYYWNFVIWKSFFIYKKVQKNVQWSPHAPPLPKLTSNITTVQYQNQETGSGTIHTYLTHIPPVIHGLMCMCVLLLLSRFSHVWLCATPEMAAHQAPPSLGFSRQEHWSGLPFPSPMHESEVAQSCLTPSDPMVCSPAASSDLPGKSTGVVKNI